MAAAKNVKIITHDGSFHADDVFAVATLTRVLDSHNLEIIRTRDEGKITTGDYVLDVGFVYDEAKNRFDHHQSGKAGVRANGIFYSSFGLVWKKFGETIAGSKEIAEIIEQKLVQPIDALDNGQDTFVAAIKGVRPYTIADLIFSFRPSWNESGGDYYAAFSKAVELASQVLEREIVQARGEEAAGKLIEEAIAQAADKRVVIFSGNWPWERVLSAHSEVLYIISPHNEKRWHLETVPGEPGGFVPRRPLPKEWAGKTGEELQKITGVSDAIFCHNNLFVASAASREGALALAKLALEYGN